MNKKFCALFAAVSLALSACSDSEAPSNQNTASAASAPAALSDSALHIGNPSWPTYMVGTEANYPPFQYRDEQGVPIGFEVELLQAIADAAEFNVHITHTSRKEWEKTLNNGRFHIWSSSFGMAPERLQIATFSKPFLQLENVINIVDNEENRNIRSMQDLKGKKISFSAYSKGADKEVSGLTGQDGVSAKTFYLALKELYAHKVDGVYGQDVVLAYYSLQNPSVKVRTINIGQEKRELGFVVKKGNLELAAKINKGLDKVRANGTYTKLVTKWFGEQVASAQHY